VPVVAATIYILVTRRVRIAPVRLLMLLALAALAFSHVRHQIVFAVAAPLLLAEPLARALGENGEIDSHWRPAAAALAMLLVLTGLRLAAPLTRGDSAVAPMSALAAVPAELRARPVLNDYAFGGYLIFSGVRPFIDSRAELYGETMLETYAAMIRPDPAALRNAIRRYGVRWSILAPDSPIVRELDAMPGWRRLHADRFAVVQFWDGDARPASNELSPPLRAPR